MSAPIRSLGVGSGLDLDGLVQRLVAAERAPAQNRLDRTEARFQGELSALGSLKGALSSLQDAASDLAASADLVPRTADSANTDVLTATADSGAPLGTFSVEVVNLASADKQASDPFAAPDSAIGTGTLTLSSGGQSFDVEVGSDANTLADIRDAINSAAGNTSISASILTEDAGSRLILTARETGAENAIAVSQSGGDGGLAALTTTTELSAAVDATIRVDTFEFSSATNQVSGVLEGLTLNLVDADPGNPVTVTVAENRSAVVDQVSNLVDRVNAFNDVESQVASFNPDTGEAGPLLGDSTLRRIDREISSILASRVGGELGFDSLPALGITTNEAGKLELDEAALNAALDERPQVLRDVLGGDDGIAARLGAFLDRAVGEGSLIAARQEGIEASIERLDDDRAALDRRIASLEQRFVEQFSALDTLIAELNQTSSFLNSQLASLPGAR